jgi:hypothetical protein
VKENLVELALDDDALSKLDESQWWFEEDGGEGEHFVAQGACKWCVLWTGSSQHLHDC